MACGHGRAVRQRAARRAVGMRGAAGAGARAAIVAGLAATVLACRAPSERGGCGAPRCGPCAPFDPCGDVPGGAYGAAPAGAASPVPRPDEEELLALAEGLVRGASPSPDAAQVDRAKALVAQVEAAGRLRPVIDRFLARATAGSPVWSQRAKHADRVVGFIRAQLCLKGRLTACVGASTEPFEEMARRHEATLAGSAVPRAERTLSHPGVLAELEARGGLRTSRPRTWRC